MNPAKFREWASWRAIVPPAAGVVAAFVFLEIAEEVLEGHATQFDRSVSLWMHSLDSPVADKLMRAFTWFGSSYFLVAVVALVAAWLLERKAGLLAGLLVAVACAAQGLNVLLKVLFHRSRPALFFSTLRTAPAAENRWHAASFAVWRKPRMSPAMLITALPPALTTCVQSAAVFGLGRSNDGAERPMMGCPISLS
jgi:hypothetical protein